LVKGQSGSPIYEIDNDGSIHVIAIQSTEYQGNSIPSYQWINCGRRVDSVVQYHGSFPS